jgi:hypothetical protein
VSDDDPPTKDASTQTIPVVITYPTDATEISDTELWDEENYTEEYWSDAREYEDAEEEMLEVDEEFEHEEEPPSPEEVCPPWKEDEDESPSPVEACTVDTTSPPPWVVVDLEQWEFDITPHWTTPSVRTYNLLRYALRLTKQLHGQHRTRATMICGRSS